MARAIVVVGGCPMWIMVNTTVMCFRDLSVIRCYSCFLHLELYLCIWMVIWVCPMFHSSLLVVIGLHVQYNNAFHFFPLHLWVLFCSNCFFISPYTFSMAYCAWRSIFGVSLLWPVFHGADSSIWMDDTLVMDKFPLLLIHVLVNSAAGQACWRGSNQDHHAMGYDNGGLSFTS